jgi:hypothetical protein
MQWIWWFGANAEIVTCLRAASEFRFAGHHKCTKLVYSSDVLYHETRFYVFCTWCRLRLIEAALDRGDACLETRTVYVY